jgi:'Cold-shock' DNA-binding domain
MLEAAQAQGIVEWFNSEKGYGLISREAGPGVFVHHSDIDATGYRTLGLIGRAEPRGELFRPGCCGRV